MSSPRQHLIIEVGVLYPLQDQLIFQKKIKKLIEKIELVNYIKNVQHGKSTIETSRIDLCNILKQLLQHHLTSQSY